MAVNVSARQFRQVDMPALVQDVLDASGIEAEFLELELTESLLMQNREMVVPALEQLKKIGVLLSLDDFGTGYSSLSYLKQFPIDVIKIDQSFIRDVTDSVDGASLTKSIIAMAKSLHMTTIAEGVETAGQLGFLNTHHCDAMQGYYFSRPLPGAEISTLLHIGTQLPAASCDPASLQRVLLLVDDEENILAALSRLLRREGYRILTTTSPLQALELLATHPVGVIVSDALMPEMPGAELLRRVKGLYPGVVRIMLSGYAELHSVTEAINEGSVYKFLTKPWDDALLREHIQESFRRYESGRTAADAQQAAATIQE
jgi:CheY-like chemotaxis protein